MEFKSGFASPPEQDANDPALRPRCYLDTSVVRGADDACLPTIVRIVSQFQVVVSALAIREIVSAISPGKFPQTRGALRRALSTPGVLQDNRLPEGIVAESFGCDCLEFRVDALKALAQVALEADSFDQFQQRQAYLRSQYGECYATDWHATDEAVANERFIAASQTGWANIRAELNKSGGSSVCIAGRQLDPATFFDDWSADGENFDINQAISVLALAADVAQWVATGSHESPIWNPDTKMVFERYRGDVDVFCTALAHYNVPPPGAGRAAKRNDIIDLNHFLYLGGRDSCDILVTADGGQAKIGKVAAPGRVWLLAELAIQ